jgi:hypothetical protein
MHKSEKLNDYPNLFLSTIVEISKDVKKLYICYFFPPLPQAILFSSTVYHLLQLFLAAGVGRQRERE